MKSNLTSDYLYKGLVASFISGGVIGFVLSFIFIFYQLENIGYSFFEKVLMFNGWFVVCSTGAFAMSAIVGIPIFSGLIRFNLTQWWVGIPLAGVIGYLMGSLPYVAICSFVATIFWLILKFPSIFLFFKRNWRKLVAIYSVQLIICLIDILIMHTH